MRNCVHCIKILDFLIIAPDALLSNTGFVLLSLA